MLSAAESQLPEGVRALIFDCDGTLVDTMPVYKAVWTELFAEHGFVLTDQWWVQTGNVALEPFVRAAIPSASDGLIDELRQRSMALFAQRMHLVEPMHHVIDVARRHHGTLPMAVCSGGFRASVISSLDAAGVTDLFDPIVCAEDVVNSKPAPDLYLLAMEQLGAGVNDVVVYEDSEVGIASARAAGIVRIVDVRDLPS